MLFISVYIYLMFVMNKLHDSSLTTKRFIITLQMLHFSCTEERALYQDGHPEGRQGCSWQHLCTCVHGNTEQRQQGPESSNLPVHHSLSLSFATHTQHSLPQANKYRQPWRSRLLQFAGAFGCLPYSPSSGIMGQQFLPSLRCLCLLIDLLLRNKQ